MMQINQALFAADLPIERKVTLTLDSGEVVEQIFYIRELPAVEMRRQVLAEQSGNEDVVLHALSTLISKAVCDSDGSAAMTKDQAGKLKPSVAGQLRDLIMEVNGLGKPQAA